MKLIHLLNPVKENITKKIKKNRCFSLGFPEADRGEDCIKWLKRDVLPREHVRSRGGGQGRGAISDNLPQSLAWPEL